MRHVVNFGLLFAFATLALTGVRLFLFPFSLTTTRVHIVAAVWTVGLISLHVSGRIPYFRNQVGGKKSAAARWRLAMITGAWGVMLIGTLMAVWPIDWLVEQSYETRNRLQIVRSSALAGFEQVSPWQQVVARIPESQEDSAKLSLLIRLHQQSGPSPAIAVWAETTTGTMIETLHLEQELAFSESTSWHGSLTARNHILPIWRNRYTAISGVEPDGSVDGVTGATENHSFALDDYLVRKKDKQFVLCVEVNAPSDTNEAWPDADIGQPSLLYTGLVTVDAPERYSILELTGHGGNAETSGNVQYDFDGITSAQKIVDLLLLNLRDSSR